MKLSCPVTFASGVYTKVPAAWSNTTCPELGALTKLIVPVGMVSSTSLASERTLVTADAVSSSTLKLIACTSGRSFTGVMVTVTVAAVEVFNAASFTV